MNKPLLFIAILLLVCVGSSVNVTTTDVNSDTEELFEHLSLEIIRPPSSSSLRKIIAPIETTVSSSSSTGQHSGETPTTATKGNDVFQNALKKAIGGGVPGAVAGVIQVLSLMWLRTIVNYQYRYGSNFIQSLSHLYSNGGISRLYSGLGFALVQAPISRFVSTAANDGVHFLIKNLEWTKHWGPGREVVVAAFVVGFFRMLLMPIDTSKTVLQIEGKKGFANLMSQVKVGKIHLLYAGSFANAASSFIGHYPWFFTYNKLSRNEALEVMFPWTTGRNALIGFISSIVSDTVANFMRVIKTTKQALSSSRDIVTYAETISVILAVDGLKGLFGRGLRTRIFANALQSVLFTVIWRSLALRWQQKHMEKEYQPDLSTEEIGNETQDLHGASDAK